MNRATKIIIATLAATGIAAGSTAFAQSKNGSDVALSSPLTIEQVSKIALEAQSGTIDEIELEREDGKAIFDVEITTETGETEVLIDAQSGEVLAVKAESNRNSRERNGHRDRDDDKDGDCN